MDAKCIKKLGRSDITVKEYFVPEGFGAVVMASVIFTFILMFRRDNLLPAPHNETAWYPWKMIGDQFPQVAQFLYDLQPKLFYPMFLVHIGEAIALDIFKLQKHSVARGTGVWWTFVVGHFFEGFTSFLRFDKKIKTLQAEKEKRKH